MVVLHNAAPCGWLRVTVPSGPDGVAVHIVVVTDTVESGRIV